MIRILVVDDEAELRNQLAWAARSEGREVLIAESGEQAVTLIQQHDFDVVITDLKMETDDTGLYVLNTAKQKDIDTQVIVVTAYGTPEISVKTMRYGAFDYLERNSPGTEFLAMLRHKIDLAVEFRKAILRGKFNE